MHRAVLQALIPAAIALVAAFAVLRLLVGISGASLQLRRLASLHRCQHGGVQSLAFVLTLPLFIMLVMFIVQVSQLMVGIMLVHYSAFAAARAAIVWTPARVQDASTNYTEELEDILPPPIAEDHPVQLGFEGSRITVDGQGSAASLKLNRVFAAAVLGIAPASPGRLLLGPISCPLCGVQPSVVQEIYRQLVPTSTANPKIPLRLQNKLAYAYWNTKVDLAFVDKDTHEGPTYNPRVLRIVDGMAVMEEDGEWIRDWNRHEVGWQDPLIVRVRHDFALLPGPGRFLAKYVVGGDGRADEVAPKIALRDGTGSVPFLQRVYTTPITATVTLTNDGFKPLLAYEQTLE